MATLVRQDTDSLAAAHWSRDSIMHNYGQPRQLHIGHVYHA